MDYSTLEDFALVERFKAGRDEAAFKELFRRYKTKLINVAMRYTGDRPASEDIAHEVFLEIYEHIDRFRGEGRFFAYLYGIAFNKAKRLLHELKRAVARETARVAKKPKLLKGTPTPI